MSDYTEEQYRADMKAAFDAWPRWERPLVRLAVWLIEKFEGTPNQPGWRRQGDEEEGPF